MNVEGCRVIDLSRTTVLLELWRVSRRARAVMDDAFGGVQLDPSEFGLYSLLLVEAPLTVTDVARRSGMPTTTASQTLQRLEERGHLERAPNPDDGRSTVVSLSDAGRAAHHEAGERFQPLIERVNETLGDELPQVTFSLVRLDGVLRELDGEPSAERSGTTDQLAERPDDARAHDLTYAGEPLDPLETEEVREFIAWLRHRRGSAPRRRIRGA